MDSGNTPVVVGVGQRSWREPDPLLATDPVSALAEVARTAAEDCGAGPGLLAALDTIGLVDFIGWRPRNAVRLLAEKLGVKPRSELATALGGEGGLVLLNEVADRIRSGRAEAALVASTHHLLTSGRARAAGIELAWPEAGEGAPELLFESSDGVSEREKRYGLVLPHVIYPIFENALRARRGLTLGEHRARMGALMARFTEVAAANPHAWFPTRRTADEIVTVTEVNRMIVYPYTKYLNAVMATDQSAALLITSEARARSLGIDPARFVYWHAGARGNEHPWFATERESLADCPSLAATARAALERGAATLDDVAAFDLYSCFPSAVEMACEVLGLAEDDPRGFTVCGGLPYAGGPGNGYTLHSAAAMVERLRSEPGARGLCTGNGWYLTKHSASLLASRAREHALVAPGAVAPASLLSQGKAVEFADDASGPARIESYTVTYARDGAPERGIIIGRAEDGRRFLANTPRDRALLEDLVAKEAVGRTGRASCADGMNRFEPL